MNMARIRYLAVVAGILCGCNQTKVKTEWKDPGYTGPAVSSVVALCLPADSKEKECEDEFVRQLTKDGISAVPGHSAIAAAGSKESAMAKAREMGVGMVLVSRFLQIKSEVDPPVYGGPMFMQGLDVWAEYPRYLERQYQVFATVLYDANGKVIWSAVSDTFASSSEKKTMAHYVSAMIKKMKHQGLIAH